MILSAIDVYARDEREIWGEYMGQSGSDPIIRSEARPGSSN